MVEVRQTEDFSSWLSDLHDARARARVLVRIDRLRLGLAGDARLVGSRVWELRIDYGPGYRVYYAWRGRELVVLLAGGDKRTQSRDIEKAQTLVRGMEADKHGKN